MELTIWRPFAGLESFNFQFNQLFDQSLGRDRRIRFALFGLNAHMGWAAC
jgi:hypothetical protein